MNIEGILKYKKVCKMAQQIYWRHHAVGRNAGSTYEEVKSHVRQSVQRSVSSVHYTELNRS
jgi:hypothetical protein